MPTETPQQQQKRLAMAAMMQREKDRATAARLKAEAEAKREAEKAKRADLPPLHRGPPTTKVVLKGTKKVIVPTAPTLPKIPGGIAMKTAGRKRKSRSLRRRTLKHRRS